MKEMRREKILEVKKRDWEDENEKGNKERKCRKIDNDRKEMLRTSRKRQ